MLAIQEYDTVLDPVYGTFTAKIKGLVSAAYLRNAAEYTGMSAADACLRSALAENMANSQAVNVGLVLVQTNQDYVDSIDEKLGRMKELADKAAAGGYSDVELAEMQSQLETLAGEIDEIAEGPLGQTHLLAADDTTEKVFIGGGLSLDIRTHDMNTSTGLDLAQIDLTVDAAAAAAKIEAARVEVSDYSAYLDGRLESLDGAASTLEVQRSKLTAVGAAIESTDAALIIVGLLDTRSNAAADILLIAQANTAAQTVLNLLAD